MPGLFICYRRDDSAGHAGRLFDSMREAFGKDHVFMDLTAIEGGQDFAEVIKGAVSSSDVMLAVIGREWLTATDERGKRRLDDPEDFIPLELGTALAGNVRVIPVLVEGARMPTAADLPEALKSLSRRQAVELRDSRWSADIQELVDLLRKTPLGTAGRETARDSQPPGGRRRGPWLIWASAGLAVTVAVVLAFFLLRFDGPDVGPSPVVSASPTVPVPSPTVPASSPTAPEPSPTVPAPSPTVPAPSPSTPEPSPTQPRPPLVVPVVVGRSLTEARLLLSQAGLRIGRVTQMADRRAAPDTVVETKPAAGTQVKAGTAVDLAIALEVRRPETSEPARVRVEQMVRVRQTFMVDIDEGRVVSGRDADVWFEAVTATERYLSPVNGASLAPAPREARLADCVSARYGLPRIPLGRVRAGSEFCVRTNGGRYGVIQMARELAPDSTSLVLGVLTWEAHWRR